MKLASLICFLPLALFAAGNGPYPGGGGGGGSGTTLTNITGTTQVQVVQTSTNAFTIGLQPGASNSIVNAVTNQDTRAIILNGSLNANGGGNIVTTNLGGGIGTQYFGTNQYLIFVGDSFTAGITNGVLDPTGNYPTQFVQMAWAKYHYKFMTNLGVAGETTSNKLAEYTNQVQIYAPATIGSDYSYIFYLAGYNDYSSVTPAQTVSNIQIYANEAKRDGFRMIVMTMTYQPFNGNPNEANTFTIDQGIRSLTNVFAVVDISKVLNAGTPNAPFIGQHPSEYGYTLIAQALNKAGLSGWPTEYGPPSAIESQYWGIYGNVIVGQDASSYAEMSPLSDFDSSTNYWLIDTGGASGGNRFINSLYGHYLYFISQGSLTVGDIGPNGFDYFLFPTGKIGTGVAGDAEFSSKANFGSSTAYSFVPTDSGPLINAPSGNAVTILNAGTNVAQFGAGGLTLPSGTQFTGNGSGLYGVQALVATNLPIGILITNPVVKGGSISNSLLAPNLPASGQVLSATDTSGTNFAWVAQSGGGALGSSPLPTNNIVTNLPIAGAFAFHNGTLDSNFSATVSLVWSNQTLTIRSNGVNVVTVDTNGVITASTITASNLTPITYSTNTIAVVSTGITNNTSSIVYLLTITAGTSLAIRDSNGNQFGTPILGDTIPLKPGWRFTGTGVTAQCYQLIP